MERRSPEGKKIHKSRSKGKSVLSGIHYQDSRGMLQINLSDAFSVLLTFSPSPKRRAVCQRAFIKLDRRENNVRLNGSLWRRADRLSQRRCLLLLSMGAAAQHPPQLPSSCPYSPALREENIHSGTNVVHYKAVTSV